MIEEIVANYIIYGIVGYVISFVGMLGHSLWLFMKEPITMQRWLDDRKEGTGKEKRVWYKTALLIFAWPYNIPKTVYLYDQDYRKYF